MLAVVAVVTLFTAETYASTIILSNVTPNPDNIDRTGQGESFDLEAFGDWLLGTGNERLNGVISFDVGAGSGSFEANYPDFTYSNGTSPSAAIEENATFRYVSTATPGPLNIYIPVAAGSGQITLWLGASNPGSSATLTANFGDTIPIDFSTTFGNTVSGSEQLFLDYSSDIAQTMTISIGLGGNNFAGYFAVATVPEPSSLMLVGMAAVVAGFRRRRSR